MVKIEIPVSLSFSNDIFSFVWSISTKWRSSAKTSLQIYILWVLIAECTFSLEQILMLILSVTSRDASFLRFCTLFINSLEIPSDLRASFILMSKATVISPSLATTQPGISLALISKSLRYFQRNVWTFDTSTFYGLQRYKFILKREGCILNKN